MSSLSPLVVWCIGTLAPTAEPGVPTLKAPSIALPPAAPAEPSVPPPTRVKPRLVTPPPPPPGPQPAEALRVPPPPARRPPRHRSRLPRGWALDLSGGTAVPIGVGVALQLELPVRVLGHLEVGGLPGAYVDVLQRLADRMRNTAAMDLARLGSRNSLVVRAGLGLRPLRRYGLEIRGGYTLTAVGSAETSLAVLEAATDTHFDDRADDLRLGLRSTLHNMHVDLGYRWVFREHIVLRTALGYVHTLASSTAVAVDDLDDPETSLAARATDAIARAVGNAPVLRAPLVSVHLGYRF